MNEVINFFPARIKNPPVLVRRISVIVLAIILNTFFALFSSFTFYTKITPQTSFLADFLALVIIVVLLAIFLWELERTEYMRKKIFSATAVLLTLPTLILITPAVCNIIYFGKNPITHYVDIVWFIGLALWITLFLQSFAFIFQKENLLRLSHLITFIVFSLVWISLILILLGIINLPS